MELNKLVLQRELEKIVTNNVFWTESKNTTTTEQNIIQKCLARSGNWTRDLSHPKRMRYVWTTEQTESIDCCNYLTVSTHSFRVETYINKAEFAGQFVFFNKFIFFWNILTSINNYICQFHTFTDVGFTASIWLKCKIKQIWSKDTDIASLNLHLSYRLKVGGEL